MNLTHGMSRSRLYRIWTNMKARCFSRAHNHYRYYGGRGIGVCPEWKQDFEPFAKWALANGYTETLEIDRKDNDLGYSPENCHWVTRKENLQNCRHKRLVNAFGETKSLREWARDLRCQVGWATLYVRLRSGWREHDAVTMPPMRGGTKYRGLAVL